MADEIDDRRYQIERLGLVVAARQVEAEVDLVASVLADPGRLAGVAAACGVTCASFDQEDLATIFAACRVAGRLGVVSTLLLARDELRRIGAWDPSAGPSDRGLWSEENLADLACAWPAHEQAVVVNARRLLRHRRLVDVARRSYGRCRRMLEVAVSESEGRWWKDSPSYRKWEEGEGEVRMTKPE